MSAINRMFGHCKSGDLRLVSARVAPAGRLEPDGKRTYVSRPNGTLQKFDPNSKKTTIESTNLPSDPKDPTRKNTNEPVEKPEPVNTTPIIPQNTPRNSDPITPANGGIM